MILSSSRRIAPVRSKPSGRRWIGSRAPGSVAAVFLVVAAVSPRGLRAQQAAAPQTFTLESAVEFALKNYPAVRAAEERRNALRARVSLERTQYLPRLDTLWQSNRATRNNIFGLLLPQSVVPSISGPVLAMSGNDSVWGSAGGLLFSWEPFDFGYRGATVRAARAAESAAGAEQALTRLDVAFAAADAFLTLLAAREEVRAAQADVERRETFAKSVHVLASNELRPGADASRADAELARARIQLIRAQQAEREARAGLATTLGIAGQSFRVEAGPLLSSLPAEQVPEGSVARHPLAEAEQARIEEAKARVHGLERSYVPRFNVQSAVAGRGSGANTDGTVAGGLNGLGLERSNWAVGLTLTFPLLDFAALHAQKQVAAANERAEAARYDQTLQDLTGSMEKARAALEGARGVAENTPAELQAAQATETQARARYQAGLGTIVEAADAQRLLVRAQIDDGLARLGVWRSLMALAVAQGDLQPFWVILHAATGGGH